MEKFTDGLLGQMQEDLQRIAFNAENPLQLAERSFFMVDALIRRLKTYMDSYIFKDEDEEILFFKNIKPQFQRELIYFEQRYHLETGKPHGVIEDLRRYYKQELKSIDRYFAQNRPFYTYYLLGLTNKDREYFVRNQEWYQPASIVLNTADMDIRFSTPFSYSLAMLQAYEQLKNYIEDQLREGPEIPKGITGDPGRRKPRTWTGPKAAAEEVVIAISEMGWISYGDGGIKEVAKDFERMFGINLDNIYRAFLGMTIRKKGYTPYIDGMKVAVEKKIRQKHE